MSAEMLVESGKEYSYSFIMRDGKTKQTGNCIVNHITPQRINFTDTKTEIPYNKKLDAVSFGNAVKRTK